MGTDPKDAFNALMAESRNTVIFTGAGISTESEAYPIFRPWRCLDTEQADPLSGFYDVKRGALGDLAAKI